MQVQSRVARTTVARMNAEIIATDRITVGLDSKQKQKSPPDVWVRRSDPCQELSMWLFS